MIKYILSVCFCILLAVSTVFSIVVSTSVPPSSITITPENISDGAEALGLFFPKIEYADDYKIAEQYLKVNFENIWKVDVFTNNTDIVGIEHQKGGLIAFDTESGKNMRLPLGWRVKSSTQSVPVVGEPGTLISSDTWYYLKDKNDLDIPNTPGDESWDAAQKSGYNTIVSANGNQYNLKDGTLCGTTAYLYVEALCKDTVAGGYKGTIWFDLYPRDTIKPKISHTPIREIGMLGNKIVINAKITDNEKVQYAKLHYKINGDSWQVSTMTMTGLLPYNKDCSKVIGAEEVKEGTICYYIEASDEQNNTTYWKEEGVPQEIKVSRSSTFRVGTKGGRIEVPDGNPDDGSTFLDIPEGAITDDIIVNYSPRVSAPAIGAPVGTPADGIDITITQRDVNDASIPDGSGACASKRPVSVYEITPSKVTFKKPVEISLLYFDFDNDGKVELDGGTETDIDETKLGIFWWDGFDWRLVGGKVDTTLNTVVTKITHLSLYAVFPINPLTADDYRPKEKIITPASIDAHNDFASFDGLYDEFEINIYDITGRKVIEINENSSCGAKWDGKDELGNVVESGVYIYQFKAKINGKMKLVSGTIVVAK